MRLSPALSVLLLPLAACGDPVVVKDYLTVINVSPAHGAVEVSADADVFVTFNGALDESTVEGRVFLQDSAEATVAAEWVYLADDLTVQLTPSEPLLLGETYTVVLAEGLTSDLGELPATIRTEFTVTTDGVLPTDDLLAVITQITTPCIVGEGTIFDGGASEVPGDVPPLFAWTLVEDPSGGQSTLTGVDLPAAELVATLEGDYTIGLTVSDGVETSEQALLTVTCAPPAP